MVQNCTFEKCGNRPEGTEHNWHPIMLYENAIGAKLKCVGSTFKNCGTHPIVEEAYPFPNASYRAVDDRIEYILENNVVEGRNEFNGSDFHANVIYESYAD